MLSLPEALKLALQLTTPPHPQNVAFLGCDAVVFYAHALARGTGTDPHAPHSPIVDLVQGIYETEPLQARRILRNRIYSTTMPTEMCRGMVKLAAKSLTAPITKAMGVTSAAEFKSQYKRLVELGTHHQSPGKPYPHSLWQNPQPPCSDQDFMRLARALAATIIREGQRYECDRPIAALLVSTDGKILSWGLNSSTRNKTLHAEVNMLQSFHQRTGVGLPAGSRIYSTLKPCRMCAGMIWQCAQDITSIKVYYDEFDAGPNARETILNPRSQERRRLEQGALLNLEIESQLTPA